MTDHSKNLIPLGGGSPKCLPVASQEEAEDWLKHAKPAARGGDGPDVHARKRAQIAAFRGVCADSFFSFRCEYSALSTWFEQ